MTSPPTNDSRHVTRLDCSGHACAGHNDVAERQDVKHDTEVVPSIRRALAERIGGERYDLWFGASTRFRVDGARLTVETANTFLQDWLRKNFRQAIEAAACETLGPTTSVGFEVDPRLNDRPSRTAAAVESDAPVGATPAASTATIAAPVESSTATAIESAPTERPRRLPAPRKPSSFDDFVVGASNRLAYASSRGVVERLGSISPLVLHGPTAVGKSHLLEAIVGGARRLERDLHAAYMTAEQFTSSFLEALQGGGLPSFRRKFRDLHLLVVDDLQFFAGKRATLVEFIHTFDALQRAGRQIVVAADRPPADLTFLGSELRTRLSGGLVVEMLPADLPTRTGIVEQLARKLALNIDVEVRDYVAMQFSSHARELSGALKRLAAVSHAFDRRIDRPMAEEALGELVRSRTKTVRLADIDRAVCQVFGLEHESLQSPRKGKDVSHPRMLAMWLARKYTRAALSEIGRFFGGRSHSTVISAEKKVAGWLTEGEMLPTTAGRCRLDEALRRVEEGLLGATN